MKRILLSTALLLAFTATAQEYQWQWAKRGGGTKRSAFENSTYRFDSEQIRDIVVDEDNNYYFLAFMTQANTEFDGTDVTVYNPQMQTGGGTDIVLISTDCEGTLRWTQTIGGGASDYAYKLVLDNNGGLYLGANILNISSSTDEYLPPHFSPTNSLPIIEGGTEEPQEGYKTVALLKYNTSDGSLAWRVMPQGDVTQDLRWASLPQITIDSQGVIHALVGLAAGTHVDGQVVVPETFSDSYKYYILKYDEEGIFLSAVPLPVEGGLLEHHTDFAYDEELQRYCIAGFRTNGNTNYLYPLSLNGIELEEQAYIMVFDGQGSSLWHKEVSSVSDVEDNRIFALAVDGESNIYISGKFVANLSEPGVSLGNFQFPMNEEGNIMYVMKLNAAGDVQWCKVPTDYTVNGSWTGVHYSYDIEVNGDELAIATQVSNEIWDDVSIDRPDNHLTDPGLLRLNKDTGEAIALHDIMTTAGTRDGLTAVAVDNDGNYIVGGYFYEDLFTLENDNVPTVTKVGGVNDYTDFFVAKLAASPCGTVGVEEHGYNSIKVYPNPTKGLVNIEAGEELKGYVVVNLLGQILQKGSLEASQNTISIESLSAGTYILTLTTTDGRVLSQKVIKQ